MEKLEAAIRKMVTDMGGMMTAHGAGNIPYDKTLDFAFGDKEYGIQFWPMIGSEDEGVYDPRAN
jgi:hypothetical protein